MSRRIEHRLIGDRCEFERRRDRQRDEHCRTGDIRIAADQHQQRFAQENGDQSDTDPAQRCNQRHLAHQLAEHVDGLRGACDCEFGKDRARQYARQLADALTQLVGEAVETGRARTQEQADGEHRPLLVDRIERRTAVGYAEEFGQIGVRRHGFAEMAEVFAIERLGHQAPGDHPVEQSREQIEEGPGEQKAPHGRPDQDSMFCN